jgi:ADP-heptose:LPS heptosyltransferase
MQSNQLLFSETKTKILIYLFGTLGDTLVAIPALRAVRRNFPNAALILLQNAPSGNNATVLEIIPKELIDGYMSYNSGWGGFEKMSDFYRLWRDLRKQKFQTAIYLVSSERPARSVQRDKFFFRSCGINNLFGFHAIPPEKLYPRDLQQRPSMTENEAVWKLRRLETDNINVLPEEDLRVPLLNFTTDEIKNIGAWLAERRKKPGSRLIAIAPGCKTQANAWSAENFIQIGRKLLAAENCELVIIGGKAEREISEKIILSWGEGINAAGEFSVRESGALLRECDFLFGLDTGTNHLAAAVGTRCFALYGERNNPGHWHPLGGNHEIIFHPVKCAGCRLFECPLPDHRCMQGITVESVWQHLRNFIQDGDDTRGATAVSRIAV